MACRSYTLLVLSDQISPARRFHITQPWLRMVLIGVTLAVLAISYLLYQHLFLQVELQHLQRTLQNEKILVGKMRMLEEDMGRLRSLAQRIHRLLGMELGPVEENGGPVGGMTSWVESLDTATADLTLQQKTGRDAFPLADLGLRELDVRFGPQVSPGDSGDGEYLQPDG